MFINHNCGFPDAVWLFKTKFKILIVKEMTENAVFNACLVILLKNFLHTTASDHAHGPTEVPFKQNWTLNILTKRYLSQHFAHDTKVNTFKIGSVCKSTEDNHVTSIWQQSQVLSVDVNLFSIIGSDVFNDKKDKSAKD